MMKNRWTHDDDDDLYKSLIIIIIIVITIIINNNKKNEKSADKHSLEYEKEEKTDQSINEYDWGQFSIWKGKLFNCGTKL